MKHINTAAVQAPHARLVGVFIMNHLSSVLELYTCSWRGNVGEVGECTLMRRAAVGGVSLSLRSSSAKNGVAPEHALALCFASDFQACGGGRDVVEMSWASKTCATQQYDRNRPRSCRSHMMLQPPPSPGFRRLFSPFPAPLTGPKSQTGDKEVI